MSGQIVRVVTTNQYPLVVSGLKHVFAENKNIDFKCLKALGLDSLREAETLRPDVFIVDRNTVKLICEAGRETFKNHLPDSKILVLAEKCTQPELLSFIKSGISGYILINTTLNGINHAIEAISSGGSYFCFEIADLIASHNECQKKVYKLTQREMDILKSICCGKTSKQIAQKYDISPRTVETHRKNIKQKLQIDNVPEIMLYFMKNELLTVEMLTEFNF